MLVYGKCECFVMQTFVSCVHPVAVLNAAFYMTCSLLMREATIGKRYTPELVSNCLVSSHECRLLFTPSCCSECFYDL